MAQTAPETTDTVVVGNGPSALVLSYILHGHIPYYSGGHPDTLLDQKLTQSPNLLQINADLFAHLRSSVKYSGHGLPVNTLLDTLLRPHGDGDIGSTSCVQWRYSSAKQVQHIVLGSAEHAGGQWASNPVEASSDIGTLSYAEQLSLPGYTFADHWQATKRKEIPEFLRPSRTDVADYFAAYPAAVAISDSIRCSSEVANISRTSNGFFIASHNIHCRHLVLASGVFSISQPPPPFLRALTNLPTDSQGPLLIVGSGLTAADIIMSTPPSRKIIHLFNWDPEHRPSPLRSCHYQAYPEYAGVYRQMKRAALAMQNPQAMPKPFKSPTSNASHMPYFAKRDWNLTYEGIPNARIIFVDPPIDTLSSPPDHEPLMNIHIGRSATGETITRQISAFCYATGRRGSLSYLSKPLLQEVLPQEKTPALQFPSADITLAPPAPASSISSRRSSVELDFADIERSELVSGRTLREKIEDGAGDMEVAKDVFAIGSLAGDALVRLAFGGCAVVAGRLIGTDGAPPSLDSVSDVTGPPIDDAKAATASSRHQSFVPTLNRILSSPEHPAGPDRKLAAAVEQIPNASSPSSGPNSKVNGVAAVQDLSISHVHPDLDLQKRGKSEKGKHCCIIF